MRQKVDLEVGKRHVMVPRWVVGIACVFVLGAAGVFAVQIAQGNLESYADEQQAAADLAAYQKDVEQTGILRIGCVSSNALRFSAWANSTIDAKTRFAAAPQYTDAAREAIIAYAKLNVHAAELLVTAASDHPLEPGSPMRDCKAIYRPPVPPEGVKPIPLDGLPEVKVPNVAPATIPPQYR